MKKCTIITYIEKNPRELLKEIDKESYIICADIGLGFAIDAGIKPDLVIADFDSYKGEIPEGINTIKVPKEKDDSDTGLCVRYAIENDYDEITIIGGIGGRLDHTVANLQVMKGAKEKGVNITMKSMGNEVFILRNESMTFKKRPAYLSVFTSDTAIGVCEKGTVYELEDYTMTSSYPLGLSNEIKGEEAIISVREGILYVIFSND